jgi:hypothetical protein
MHKLLLALVVAFAGLTAVAAPSASARDYNCSDFANQKRAQFFFLRHGGPRRDRHRLDADGDGIACESLPCPCYRKKRLPTPRFHDRDCSDFANQRRAQLFFLRHGGPRRDRHRLDTDHDGVACEGRPCPCFEESPPPSIPPSTPPPYDRDCSDFANQEDAQTFFVEEGGPASDPHQLDGDGDGIACESLP